MYLPKNTFIGHTVLQIGVYEAVLSYNNGFQSSLKVLLKLGIKSGFDSFTLSHLIDERRIQKADVMYCTVLARSTCKHRALQEKAEDDSDYQYGGY